MCMTDLRVMPDRHDKHALFQTQTYLQCIPRHAKRKITEKEAARYVKMMLQALAYLASPEVSVVHRDIKPENFLFRTLEPSSDLALIDLYEINGAQLLGLITLIWKAKPATQTAAKVTALHDKKFAYLLRILVLLFGLVL